MTFLHSIARYWSPHLKHKPLAWGFSKGKMNRSLPRLNDEFSGGNGDLRVEKGSVPLLFSKRLRTWPTQCVMPPNLCKWISDPANLGTETLKYTRSPIIEQKKIGEKTTLRVWWWSPLQSWRHTLMRDWQHSLNLWFFEFYIDITISLMIKIHMFWSKDYLLLDLAIGIDTDVLCWLIFGWSHHCLIFYCHHRRYRPPLIIKRSRRCCHHHRLRSVALKTQFSWPNLAGILFSLCRSS